MPELNINLTTSVSATPDSIVRRDEFGSISTVDLLASGNIGANQIDAPLIQSTGILTLNGNSVETINNKDASGGYAGLTLFKINFKNVLNTFTSFFTNSNTAARTYTFQDRNGTIADDTDLALKANLSSLLSTRFIGSYYTFRYVSASTASAMSNNRIVSTPIEVETPHYVSHLRIAVTTLFAGSTCRIALYDDNGSGRPGALLEESGLIDCSTTGEKEYQFTSPIYLSNPLVHAVFQVSSSGIQFRSATSIIVVNKRESGAVSGSQWQVTPYTYGAMPANFPAGGASVSNLGMIIELKRSA